MTKYTRRPQRTPLTGTASKLQNFTVTLNGIDTPFFVLATSKATAVTAAITAAGLPANKAPLASSVTLRSVPVGSALHPEG